MPFVLEAAGLLATLTHPNQLLNVSSSGFARLLPTCNAKFFGYITFSGIARRRSREQLPT
ncbi:hypothetical protein CU276_00845 [Yersinia kristensenii]|nr:hypothetical protein CU276_00845 [Yersinia kristensenii]